MFKIQGKYAEAVVYADIADNAAISQVLSLCNQPFTEGQKIRMMPDIHAGAGCTIGTTMTIGDKVVPNLVGVDIGCGVAVVALEEQEIDFEKLDRTIRERVPSGFSIHESPLATASSVDLENLRCYSRIDHARAARSIGTLGGGNHFIEVDRDDDGRLCLAVHTGSRHLGVEIATHYQDLACKEMNEAPQDEVHDLIAKLKAQGRQREIQAELKKLKSSRRAKVPKDLAYLEGRSREDYLHDMGIAQKYAQINRSAILDVITGTMGLHIADSFETVHNYIDLDQMILRKGAVSAKEGERLIIPMNMRDGALICTGKGNPEWNFSAPHGAGRLMSRGDAKSGLSVEEFRKEMEGIFSTSVGVATLDESPMAYKPMESILHAVDDTVSVERVTRPVYNFKAGNA